MEKRVVVRYFILVLIFLGLVASLFFLRNAKLSGFAVFQQSGSDFDLGTYVNISYNGSSLVLSGSNLTGTYTSRVFEASSISSWNNLTWQGGIPTISILYAVVGNGFVYTSSNQGVTWTIKNSSYGRTTDAQGMFSDSSGNLYIITNTNREVWKSINSGVTWNVINKTFSSNDLYAGCSDNNGNLFVAAATTTGRIYKSNDEGVTWLAVNSSIPLGNLATTKGLTSNSTNSIFLVSGGGYIYSSIDSGINWVLVNSSYGRTTDAQDMFSDSLNNLYIITNTNREVWKSTNSGVTWNVINKTFSNKDLFAGIFDSSNNLYVIAGGSIAPAGLVYKSTDSGVTWTLVNSSFISGAYATKGLTSLIKHTNLTFQVKNCSSSGCSDGTWQSVALNNINLTSKYFQYKIYFSTQDASIGPVLYNVSIDYTLINRVPNISLISPQQGATYGYNESLPLTFAVSDSDNNLASCWYDIDSGNKVIISSCQNTTFNVSSGSHVLNIYANDSYGLESQDSASFLVQLGAPTIILNSPIDTYLDYNEVEFKYTPTDIDLASCGLWGNFEGEFKLNQTNNNPYNGTENIFSLNLSDGDYLWNIRCNDSQGNSVFNGNKSFVVDTVNPEITISEPKGTKTSRNIGASWSVSDANIDECWYNVYRGASLEVVNTSVNCGLAATFSVTVDADFIFNFYAEDKAGNINSASSSFTVSTSQPPVIIGGGGGGGGGSSTKTAVLTGKIKIYDIGDVIVNPGESKTLVASVENIGTIFLNKCRLTDAGNSGLISSKDVKGLAVGQKEDFIFGLNIPEDFKDRVLDIVVKCEEAQESRMLNVLLSKNIIEVELISSEQKGNKLNFVYLAREKTGNSHDVDAVFWMEDSNGAKISEGSDSFSLDANQELRRESSLNLGEAGEYVFNLELEAEGYKTSLEEQVIVGKSTGLLGRAILVAGGGKTLLIGILIVLALFFAVFFIRKKLMEKADEKEGYIKIKTGK